MTGPAVWVKTWYDRRSRSWIVQKLDLEGNQIGDAAIAGTKAGALAYEKEFKAEIEKDAKQ